MRRKPEGPPSTVIVGIIKPKPTSITIRIVDRLLHHRHRTNLFHSHSPRGNNSTVFSRNNSFDSEKPTNRMVSRSSASKLSSVAAAMLWCFLALSSDSVTSSFHVVDAFSSTTAPVRVSPQANPFGSASSGVASWSPTLPTIKQKQQVRRQTPHQPPNHYPLTLQSTNSNAESDALGERLSPVAQCALGDAVVGSTTSNGA